MNLALILLVLVAAGIGVFLLLKNDEETQFKETVTNYDELELYIRRDIDKRTLATTLGIGLSMEDVEKQSKQIEDIKRFLRTASSGDKGARSATKQIIRRRLFELVKKNTIEKIVPFDPAEKSWYTNWLEFEAILYMYDSGLANGGTIQNDDGFKNLMEQYEIKGIITEEMIHEIYQKEHLRLEYDDKINILTQTIFADLYGLGITDTLNYQSFGVEELQIGVNGPQMRAYDYSRDVTGRTERCAKDSIELIYCGNRVRLPFLGFKSDAEMQRVIRNLTINSGAGELTEANPKIVADTIDGRRITASRPPQTDAWLAFIRKFNNIADINIRNLYADKFLTDTITFLAKSGAHIAVTGEMESGKTTLLRSIIAETDSRYAIRIVENEAFELNGRMYFPERNVTSMRITQDLDEESVLAFAKKTSGHIFSIGEVNSLNMANLCNKISKIATQVLYSAHYTTTAAMVSDFTNAKLCNGFTNERLAEIEAVESMNFDIHVINRGKRYIGYINEVVLTDTSFEIIPILKYEMDGTYKPMRRPSKEVYRKAKRMLNKEEYEQFESFFNNNFGIEGVDIPAKKVIPAWVKER